MNATRINASRNHRRNMTANRYPNAASKTYYVEKLVDTALCSASFVGVIAVIFFLATSF